MTSIEPIPAAVLMRKAVVRAPVNAIPGDEQFGEQTTPI
jgi:hypothetical protein